jgi:hypothetical protein
VPPAAQPDGPLAPASPAPAPLSTPPRPHPLIPDAPPTTTRARTHAKVRIVRERATGKVMAMKKLKKAEMLRRGQVRGSNPDHYGGFFGGGGAGGGGPWP